MEDKLEAIRIKIHALLIDLNFHPSYVDKEKPMYDDSLNLIGRVHACCCPNSASHRKFWMEAKIAAKSSMISVWDADTGEAIFNTFKGDDAIEKMLEFIRNKLPGL